MSEQKMTDNGAQQQSGRDSKGQFTTANTFGAGNQSSTRQAARVRKILYEVGTDERLRAVFEALFDEAAAGDVQAIKLVLTYTLGKPSAAALPPEPPDNHQDQAEIPAPVLSVLSKREEAFAPSLVAPGEDQARPRRKLTPKERAEERRRLRRLKKKQRRERTAAEASIAVLAHGGDQRP